MNLRQLIESYRPYDEAEARDRELMLYALEHFPDVLSRENPVCHFTASNWITSRSRDKILLVHHNIYKHWAWTGGHADGDEDLPAVALREVREETGVRSARLVSDEILSLEVLTVDGHEKRGEYVSSHLHLNVTYLIEADERDPLTVCEEENSGVRWFTPEGALAASTEPWFVERIYKKLNARI